MKILIGTTNPSKVIRFKELLKDEKIEFVTLSDLNITMEPLETGQTPEENAIIKAKYYASLNNIIDIVICNDSGLYFEELNIKDPLQPGLKIRTPKNKRLDDEEMIEYYAKLINSLGGKVNAFYLDGIAVYNKGKIYSFMDQQSAKNISSFYMIDTPSNKRHPGWPLDSISIYKETGKYFVDQTPNDSKEKIIKNDYKEKTIAFLKHAINGN